MTTTLIQPQVDATLPKLATGYEHMEMFFDLYGMNSKFGIDVMDVTLHGDKRSLIVLFSAAQIKTMCDWCEREAEKEIAQERRDAAIDAGCAAMAHRGLREFASA